MNITALKPRIGISGMLIVSDATVFTKRVATPFANCRPNARDDIKPYETSFVSSSFATYAYAQQCEVNSFIDLVLRVQVCEEREAFNGENFLQIHGVDMDGHHIGPLRLWRFGRHDMEARATYIIRGLKVVLESYWCNTQMKYVPTSSGNKSLEASWRTAVEDVSEVQ